LPAPVKALLEELAHWSSVLSSPTMFDARAVS
jgi:hypothetical protein